MDIKDYLDRIQVNKMDNPDLQGLAQLQKQHLLHIYFENLDILAEEPIRLDVQNLFNKIVLNHRGGVCFELNFLFHHLLKQLGFNIQITAATVYGENEWFPIEHTHLTNLVIIDEQTYLVDVGYGGNSPRHPIPLSGEVIKDVDGSYRITLDANKAELYVFEKKINQSWQKLYRFTTEKKSIEDFEDKCDLIEHSHHSPFNKGYFLSKVTEKGRITLVGESLTIVEGTEKKKKVIHEDESDQVIKEYFNISN